MSGINELIRIGFFSILIIATLAISSSEEVALYDRYDKPYSNYLFLDKRIQYLMDTKRSVMGIKNLIDDLHNKLEKRTACILDGGLSASCNHKDAVEAGQHHRFLASSFAPGRRKRDFGPPPLFSPEEKRNFQKNQIIKTQ